MTEPKRERVQIDMSHAVRRRAKTVAIERDMTLVQLVLIGLSKVGDKALTELIEKELAEKTKPGRPQK
ncbi:MAG: hypothetical protein WBP22_02485 [Candidatus Saccharimonas sp.]